MRRSPRVPRGAQGIALGAREVLGSRARVLLLLALGVPITILYSLLLPFEYTQRVGIGNWAYLTPLLGFWSVLLGFGIGFLLLVQIYSMRTLVAARPAKVGGGAALISLLPSFLCCTPLIPTLLAFVGLSGGTLYSTTGGVQHFFATEQTPLLLFSLALILASSGWGLHRLVFAECREESSCGPAAPVQVVPAPRSALRPMADRSGQEGHG